MHGLDVLVSCFKHERSLELCLAGLAWQEDQDFRVLLVNDGGDPEIQELADRWSPKVGQGIVHVYLEPPCKLFRKSMAMNQALRYCWAERLLFLDGDILALPDVLGNHRQEQGIVSGLRYHIRENHAKKLDPSTLNTEALQRLTYKQDKRIQTLLKGQIGRVFGNWVWVIGCQVSYPTAVVQELGGLWELFMGWGDEDNELAWRVEKSGIPVHLRTDLIGYHLDHPTRMVVHDRDRNRYLREISQNTPGTLLRNRCPIQKVPLTPDGMGGRLEKDPKEQQVRENSG